MFSYITCTHILFLVAEVIFHLHQKPKKNQTNTGHSLVLSISNVVGTYRCYFLCVHFLVPKAEVAVQVKSRRCKAFHYIATGLFPFAQQRHFLCHCQSSQSPAETQTRI